MRKHRRPGAFILAPHEELHPLVRLWILRILVPLGGYRHFIKESGFQDDEVAAAIGLGHWFDLESSEFDAKVARRELRSLYQRQIGKLKQARVSGCLERNLHRLSKLAGLSGVDARILEFAVLIHNDRILDEAADMLGNLSSVKMYRVLARILEIPEKEVRAALGARDVLQQSGLLSVDRGSNR